MLNIVITLYYYYTYTGYLLLNLLLRQFLNYCHFKFLICEML